MYHKWIAIMACLFALTASMSRADEKLFQNYPLTDGLIAAALEAGARAKGKDVGLKLRDQAQGFMMALDGKGTTGFSVHIQTPYTWIAQQASWRAKKYQEMTAEDVTDEMKEPVMMVICNPDMPTNIAAGGLIGSSGVEHVIIRSTAKKNFKVAQPTETESGSELTQNAFGAQVELGSLVGYFAMDEVMRISSLDKKDEFFVVIIGDTGEEKKFKIKTKHFKKLP